MKRIGPYLASATLGIALLASHPTAAQTAGFGMDRGYPTYPSYSTYPSYYSRIYGYPYGYASTRYAYSYPYNNSAYSYPYAYSAWNYSPYDNWGSPFGGIASLAAAPIEVAGAAVTAPFAVAANTQAPLVNGRSVAVEQPYYARRERPYIRHMNAANTVSGRSVAVEQPYFARRTHEMRHAHYMGRMSARHAYNMHHMNYGRSAYIPRER